MSCDRLELIGLHCRLGDVNPETIEDTVWAMNAQMAWVRREYGLILTRVACASSSRLSGATIATTCAATWMPWRKPLKTPARGTGIRGRVLVLSLRQSALIPPE
jgi:hypothetical protein